jgi:phosphoglycerate dehydrogenase-like enzyme
MGSVHKSYKVALLLNRKIAGKLLHPDDLEFLKSFNEYQDIDSLPQSMSEEYMRLAIAGADVCITSLGTPRLTEAVLNQAPGLKIIAHSAGSIKSIVCDSVWSRNIRVTSAAPVIAEDVAETVLGLMIISLKRVLPLQATCRSGNWYVNERDGAIMKPLSGATIGLIGASNVGRNVIKLLKPFNTKILLYDPYITEQQAADLGLELIMNCIASSTVKSRVSIIL